MYLLEHNKRKYGTLHYNLIKYHICFSQELELLPTKEIQQNIYIKHPVSIEQYLMEGSYNKVIFCKLYWDIGNFLFSMRIIYRWSIKHAAQYIEHYYFHIDN